MRNKSPGRVDKLREKGGEKCNGLWVADAHSKPFFKQRGKFFFASVLNPMSRLWFYVWFYAWRAPRFDSQIDQIDTTQKFYSGKQSRRGKDDGPQSDSGKSRQNDHGDEIPKNIRNGFFIAKRQTVFYRQDNRRSRDGGDCDRQCHINKVIINHFISSFCLLGGVLSSFVFLPRHQRPSARVFAPAWTTGQRVD